MGQYFLIANITKKEYLIGNCAGHGLKFIEQYNTMVLLRYLIRQSTEGGGGDIDYDGKYCGRWAGDRITMVGDYDESHLFDKAQNKFINITHGVLDEWNSVVEYDDDKIERVFPCEHMTEQETEEHWRQYHAKYGVKA